MADAAKSAENVADTVGKAIYSLLAGISFKAGVPNALQLSFDANKVLAKAEQMDQDKLAANIPRSFYHASFVALAKAFSTFTDSGKARRIVVFVDDLDRCLADSALEVLESMKLFFDLPGFVFVVGLDRRVVELSVDKRYRDLVPPDGNVGNLVSGAQYLRKIFQVPYSLAPVSTTQIDEFLQAIKAAAQLQQSQWDEIQNNVRPHLRFLTGESGVNAREVKRYINAYTLVRKTRSLLDKDVVLALQTIAFRPDWAAIQLALLAFRNVFLDTLRRHIEEPGLGHIDNLDPSLALPQSFLDFVGINGPGKVLLSYQDPIDDFIYSGEATRSSEGTPLIDLFRAMGDLIQTVKKAEREDGTFVLGGSPSGPFEDKARMALSMYMSLRGSDRDQIMIELEDITRSDALESFEGGGANTELSGIDKTELDRDFEAGRETLLENVRVTMRNLQELYKAGAF